MGRVWKLQETGKKIFAAEDTESAEGAEDRWERRQWSAVLLGTRSVKRKLPRGAWELG